MDVCRLLVPNLYVLYVAFSLVDLYRAVGNLSVVVAFIRLRGLYRVLGHLVVIL